MSTDTVVSDWLRRINEALDSATDRPPILSVEMDFNDVSVPLNQERMF